MTQMMTEIMIPTTTTTLDAPPSPDSYHQSPALYATACRRIKCGRSKGTNYENKTERIKAYKTTVNGAAQKFRSYIDARLENKNRSPGKMKMLTQEEKEKNKVSENISLENMHSCIKQGDHVFSHPRTEIPLKKVEDIIFEIVVQKVKINQPLTCQEGLELANILIKGTKIKQELIEFKKKRFL